MTKNRTPTFLPIVYCTLCENYGALHQHEANSDSDLLDYDNYTDID